MVRSASIVLGVAMTIVWLLGMNQHATGWLTWLDGAAALGAFAVAGAVRADSGVTLSRGAVVLSTGLFAIWAAGLMRHTEGWLTWWTFAFGVGFLLVGALASTEKQPPIQRTI